MSNTYLGPITTDWDKVNKKYVDDSLQGFMEFKVYNQVFSQSGVNSFDKTLTIDAGWTPYGFFTCGTEGGVGYGYQSYAVELTSPTTVRCKGWANINGGSQIRIWLPCYRYKFATNTLAYTTRDILWSGTMTSTGTIQLTHQIGDYDYIEFIIGGKADIIYLLPTYRVPVNDLVNAKGSGNMIFPITWGLSGSGNNRWAFINGRPSLTSTSLAFVFGENTYLYEVRGIRVTPEKDLMTRTIVTGACDGSGYFKNSGSPWELPLGKTLIGVRPLTLAEGQSSTFWNSVTGVGCKITPLFNPNSAGKNLWSILFRGWDDANNYANMTGIKAELIYV